MAADPVQCESGEFYGGSYCRVAVSTPPAAEVVSTRSGSGSSGACYSGSGAARTVVACSFGGGWWSESRGCYMLVTDPEPGDLGWHGNDPTKGHIYTCQTPDGSGSASAFEVYVADADLPAWAAVAPAQLAARLVEEMTFDPIRIGSTPKAAEGSIGLIGLPTWLWVDNRSATTVGPQSRSVTLGGTTVTATAKVVETVWLMGDGGHVRCAGPGTPYDASYGRRPSPDCNYWYAKQGHYTVTASARWSVHWTSSTGDAGTIPLTVTSTAVITMGEAQVILR